MQPYFFPYWGHFSLIAHTEKWVVFDESQYKPKSWMSRNRVLHPRSGWQYLSVPLSNSSRNIRTYQAKINDAAGTKSLFKRKLGHYKDIAPFYWLVLELIEEAFGFVDDNDSLTSLCHGSIYVTCRYLGIKLDSIRSSELNVNYPDNIKAGQWAPCIASHINASGYLNPISGVNLFDRLEFESLGLGLKFLKTNEFNYSQLSGNFCANLSILDSMMWLPPEMIRNAIFKNVEILDADATSAD